MGFMPHLFILLAPDFREIECFLMTCAYKASSQNSKPVKISAKAEEECVKRNVSNCQQGTIPVSAS